MKRVFLILITCILLYFIYLIFPRTVNEDEIWSECIELEDGSLVYVYHSGDCNKEKPLFFTKQKKIDFIKFKYYVFDYCLDEKDVEVLNVISKNNIKEYYEKVDYTSFDDFDREYYKSYEEILDSSNTSYEVYYSVRNDTLIHLDRYISVLLLNNK